MVCYAWLGPRYLDNCQKLMTTIHGPLSKEAYELLRGHIFSTGNFGEFQDFFTMLCQDHKVLQKP